MKRDSKKKIPFSIYFLTIVIYTLPVMAIIGLNIDGLVPFIVLPMFLIWFGFISAGNCIKPYTVIAVLITIFEMLYILLYLSGLQIHWYVALSIINIISAIIGWVVFLVSVFFLTKWNGSKMSDDNKKDRLKSYNSRLNCYCLMNFVFLFYNLVISVIMFFRHKQLQWFYIWLFELVVIIIMLLSFVVITKNAILHSKICED